MEIISRKDAHEKGLTHFYTGKPCKRQHIRERSVKTGSCLGCLAHYAKEYRTTYNAAPLELKDLSLKVRPEHVHLVSEFAELCRLAFVNGTPPPAVPRHQDVPTVNTMIAMLVPQQAAPPVTPGPGVTMATPPVVDTRNAMWVRIHGQEIADQMLEQAGR